MKHSWVAEEAGITAATLSNILTGRTSDPGISIVMAIARAMGLSVGELLGERPAAPFSESEQETLRRALEIVERRVFRSRSAAGASASEGEPEAERVPRPAIPAPIAERGARQVFRARGDAMADEGIGDGDMVYVRPESDPRRADGRIVVCRIDDLLMVRKLMVTGRSIRLLGGDGYRTVSENDAFELIGVVVGHLGAM